MPIRCVEPALADPNDPNVRSLVNVPAGTDLIFPHVDSCLAIAMVLADGRIIGGHVSMQLPDPNAPLNPAGNAATMLANMNILRAGTAVSQLVFIGDGNWLHEFVTGTNVIHNITVAVGCLNRLHVNTGAYGGGVDCTFDTTHTTMSVVRCLGGQVVLNRACAAIIGIQNA